jgi:signal peptidase I
MRLTTPPPLPRKRTQFKAEKLVLGGTIALGVLFLILVVLRVTGLISIYSVPSNGMAPELKAGDKVFAERFTFLSRFPQRGDVIVFRTNGIPLLETPSVFVQRIVGESGDRVRFAEGTLYVNNQKVELRNSSGLIKYTMPSARATRYGDEEEKFVPEGHYFVVGDNSFNSLDSRFWGPLPAKNVLGLAAFRYAPTARIGPVR